MRKTYNLETICKFLKIDVNKKVTVAEATDLVKKIKGKFDVVFRDEFNWYKRENPAYVVAFISEENKEKHSLDMWLTNWEVSNDYELLGFKFNDFYADFYADRKIK